MKFKHIFIMLLIMIGTMYAQANTDIRPIPYHEPFMHNPFKTSDRSNSCCTHRFECSKPSTQPEKTKITCIKITFLLVLYVAAMFMAPYTFFYAIGYRDNELRTYAWLGSLVIHTITIVFILIMAALVSLL